MTKVLDEAKIRSRLFTTTGRAIMQSPTSNYDRIQARQALIRPTVLVLLITKGPMTADDDASIMSGSSANGTWTDCNTLTHSFCKERDGQVKRRNATHNEKTE